MYKVMSSELAYTFKVRKHALLKIMLQLKWSFEIANNCKYQ